MDRQVNQKAKVFGSQILFQTFLPERCLQVEYVHDLNDFSTIIAIEFKIMRITFSVFFFQLLHAVFIQSGGGNRP